ncbi:MAG: radical SAM protein [Bacteroidaceae bacterium]|nr:radical SAM protein [Bacteroidaceae bacterium]
MDTAYNQYINKKKSRVIGLTYTSPIFGPIHSRRLGISLGINLLPDDGKWCNFDCIYCECGLNRFKSAKNPLPTAQQVVDALVSKLQEMKAGGITPDVLTFAGNGEPTMHPDFPEIAQKVISVRNRYCPDAKVSILSNSTQIHRDDVREVLMQFDNNILKLDTVDAGYINRVNQPTGGYDLERVVENMCKFNGNLIIQTMFMKGVDENNISVDNTGDKYVEPYIQALKRIKPKKVMIYTIDRNTPVETLKKAGREELDSIADRIRREGMDVSVSY